MAALEILGQLNGRDPGLEATLQSNLGQILKQTGRIDEALARLRAHTWPGNVRELRNALERATVLAEGERIEADDLPEELGAAAAPAAGFHGRVEEYRRTLLRDTLAETGGNQAEAARRLGLQRTYLARLVRRYGL